MTGRADLPEGIAFDELALPPGAPLEQAVAGVRDWIRVHVPEPWRSAAAEALAAGTPPADAVRRVRPRAEYVAWYPTFARSGLAVATWPVPYGGLDLAPEVARAVESELAPLHLGRLNPIGLNNAAPALFAHGTEAQRQRFLPPLVRNEERWCQLFSEPGAGSDLASLATRAVRDGDDWVVTGQKVWTTWGFDADFGVLLARTDPDVPKRRGITYFLLDLRQPGVEVRPLRHLTGEVDFCEVFLDAARVPDANRVGAVGDGWRVAGATLAGERQMVAGAGSGGVDRIGGAGIDTVLAGVEDPDPLVRDRLMGLLAEERVRAWTNHRVRAGRRAGRPPGPESSVGKVHQGSLNQRLQLAAADLLGPGGQAWDPSDGMPRQVRGMLRSRANTIEGGTTEVNKNIVGERVLGLPRDPDPFRDQPWSQVPRS
jgi:alkylation response protein AidB-like acyl-CoA dehydrogenase